MAISEKPFLHAGEIKEKKVSSDLNYSVEGSTKTSTSIATPMDYVHSMKCPLSGVVQNSALILKNQNTKQTSWCYQFFCKIICCCVGKNQTVKVNAGNSYNTFPQNYRKESNLNHSIQNNIGNISSVHDKK